MAGQRLRDKPRKSTQPAAVYAEEIADLFVQYEAAAVTNWRNQDAIWKELRKKLAQYKIAKTREDKEQQRQLWQIKKQRKVEAARERAETAKLAKLAKRAKQ